MHDTLRRFRETIQNNGSTHDLQVNALMAVKVEECEAVLKGLQDKLNLISPALYSIHERLVSFRRCIKAAEAKKKVRGGEVGALAGS